MTSRNPPRDTLEFLRSSQRAVLVTFGSVIMVSDRVDELRLAYAHNDRVHATHNLPGLDTVEIHLNGILDLLVGDQTRAGAAIRDASTSYLVSAFNVLSPSPPVSSFSPLFKYYRHIRNACAHGGNITYRDRRAKVVRPASWRGRTIDLVDEGKPMWPHYIGFPSTLFLVQDAFKERFPMAPDLVPMRPPS